jgi:hypothetical protein
MRTYLNIFLLLLMFWPGCKSRENKIVLPDLRPNFLQLLRQRDTLLILDSFYFIRIDTMNEKKALTHQRFAFLHIMENIDGQLEWMGRKKDSLPLSPSANDQQTTDYLHGEKAYVGKEIDSLTSLIEHADSVTPIGYRAFYKATVRKKDQFVVSDTVPYSISMQMNVSDWDRNLEKMIDALATGKQLHPGSGP